MKTYTNPVFDRYFADPFVLRVGRTYFAYGTGSVIGGRVFEVLRSDDLVTWTSVGGALEPLGSPDAVDCWAPEITIEDGTFWMYYSVGVGDKGHRLRAASSPNPEGPFRDAGVNLSPDEPFAIDPSPFVGPGGERYLYYAVDRLEGNRVGTVLAVDRMAGMTRLEGSARIIVRATGAWQLFAEQRSMYGGVHDWHTMEGPAVVGRGGRYYCLYSGGNWERETYGVSYAVADHPMGPFREERRDGPALLRTLPGRVVGPGHCSVVTTPDGTDVLTYHAWDVEGAARRLCIDRLEWSVDGPSTPGPTWTPQPVPAV